MVLLLLASCVTGTRRIPGSGTAELVVRDFCDRFGRQKGFAIASLFADSARLDIDGVHVSFVGRDDIARFAGYGVAVHERLAVRDIELAHDSVRCRLEESNDWLDLLGVRRAVYDGRFRVSGGRILGARLDLAPGSREELSRELAGFLTWLAAEDPRALERLLPGGRPAYDPRLVPELVRRLKQYRLRSR